MIKRLLMIVLMLASGSAFADYPAPILSAMFNNNGGNYKTWPTVEEACDYEKPIPPSSSVSSRVLSITGPLNDSRSYTCRNIYKDGSSGVLSKDIRFKCWNGTAPRVTDGYVNTCIGDPPPPPCTPNGPFEQNFIYPAGVSESTVARSNLPSVVAGCVVVPRSVVKCEVITASNDATRIGRVVCKFMVERTGEPALNNPPVGDPAATGGLGTAEKAASSTLPPTSAGSQGSCPKGSVQGGFDSRNIPICIGTGTAPKNPPPTQLPKVEKPPTSVTNEDGSTTTTKETVTSNSDGSTTTTKEIVTTAPDGTVTRGGTSETGATPGGAAGQSDAAKDSEKNDLCKTNPTLSVCRNSSVSGSCEQITCEGDAIQCATLRAAAAMQCQQKKDLEDLLASPLKTLGASASVGADPLKGSFPTVAGASKITMPSQLDTTGWLGGGSCFADKTITVQGAVITLPLSAGCDAMLVLRYALMVVSALVSFRILSGAVLT